MKNLYSFVLAVALIIPASQAKQQSLAYRVEKYLPALQQSINDASMAGDVSVKIPLPGVKWKEYGDIVEYLKAAGYGVVRYGDNDSQALVVKW